MYSILGSEYGSQIVSFTFATIGLENNEWHHDVLIYPMVGWLEKLPESLNDVETAIGCILSFAKKESIPIASIDWLGLALLASDCFRKAAGELHSKSTQEESERCGNASQTADLLQDIFMRVSRGIRGALHSWAPKLGDKLGNCSNP